VSASRSPSRGRWWRAGAVTLAAGLTVALSQSTTGAVFTGQTVDTGNSVAAAGNFCAGASGTTLTATADTTVYQGNPTTPYGSDVSIAVTSGAGGNARALVRFTLPGLGTGCTITAATLRLYVTSGQTGRTIDVYRIDPASPAWTEGGTTWNTAPGVTGTSVGAASLAGGNWQTWDVTAMLPALYTSNSGFLVRDSVDSTSPTRTQYWDSRDSATAATRPQLVLTWG
jgi:hypothetical protein